MKKKSLIPSPCVSICTMDEETGFCLGCYRSLDEISRWDSYTDERKRQVLEHLSMRSQPSR